MKILFSYKNEGDLFGSILALSVAGHVLAFGVQSMFSPSPEYSVTQGVSSVEINIIEEIKQSPEELDKVLTAKPVEEVREVVKQEIEEKKPEPVPQLPLQTRAFDGALNENSPDYLRNPAPVYPLFAREKGWEGLVLLRAIIGKAGNVEELSVEQSSGYSILDQSALKTVKTWQFKPAQLAQFKFSSTIKIPVRFLLTDEE